MSSADGFEVLRRLKTTIATKWIPVVMLTNMDNLVDQERCFGCGASDYLVKVRYTPAELVAYTRGVLL